MRACVWLGEGAEGNGREHVFVGRRKRGGKRVVRAGRGGYVHSATAIIDEKGIDWAGKVVMIDG